MSCVSTDSVHYEARVLGLRLPILRPNQFFTTIKVVSSPSHKFLHLHFGALENQNVGSFLMLKLAANSSQICPLVANLFPLWGGPVVLAGSGWGSFPGSSGAIMSHGTTWLDCATPRPKSQPWSGPRGVDSLLPPQPSVSRV